MGATVLDIFTIGYGHKKAETFFETLKAHGIKVLIDIRLNNTSQLAGYTKKGDLSYFLGTICGAQYRHLLFLAPSKEIFEAYKKKGGSWEVFQKDYLALLEERRVEEMLDPRDFETPTVFLCAEPEPDHCHRRFLAEYLQRRWVNVKIRHL
jgi:uncharacterized protein (DUF488 family)